ncbi:MAG: branched-chain amino acid ABC transporter permease [Rhodobacteraceae bacterium]|nr:MAG: branched-chain amino acid ABC transporter permease [Paracoccaceae bacterium]
MGAHKLTTDSIATPAAVQARAWRDGLVAYPGTVAFLLLMAIAVPFLGAFWVRTFTAMLIIAIGAWGVAILQARLGLVSLAGIAMIGLGGWIALRLNHATGLPFEVVLILTAAITAMVALVLGLPALRHRGLLYSLLTLMFAAAFHVIVSSVGFPDGGSGFWGRVTGSTQRMLMPRPAIAQGHLAYFFYVLVVVALCFAFSQVMLRSRLGRAWAMIRISDSVAQSCGIRVGWARAKAFALAGGLAGVAGCLWAGSVGQLDGRSFDPLQSLLLFGLVVVAGPWSMIGALLAGFLYRVFPAILDSLGVTGHVATMIFGAALIHAIVTAPRGIAGQLEDLFAAISRRLDTERKRQ